ncbi:MAG: acyl carrier protein [Oscillospiraceae bacterium]|jgi:acyl carrier protein|nr:acyl carrier protein [Oscillospiraceae bacterium]MBQ9695934.1 acyl carrier protein [Oscillospiraceae bacterium]MBR1897615.1 acyl carrier protein [Oscillospiraceae bacterium]
MSNEQIMERLTAVFRHVFDDDDIVLTANTSSKDIDDWDSLEHINLIGAVERTFGMRFQTKEVSGMKNVGEMAKIIAERATK